MDDGRMRDGLPGDQDVAALARQAVDLLYPPAQVSVDALNRGGRWSTWGGLSMQPHRPRRVTVRISADNRCLIGVNPDWSPVITLAHLVTALGDSCGHRFRGVWFPPCPRHPHAATVDIDGDTVVLRCPDSGWTVQRLIPDVTAT
jgi:hypothetical protein